MSIAKGEGYSHIPVSWLADNLGGSLLFPGSAWAKGLLGGRPKGLRPMGKPLPRPGMQAPLIRNPKSDAALDAIICT